MKNRFIIVEGLDGSGKTTVVSKIIKYLRNRNITNVISVHEPGGTPIADMLQVCITRKSQKEFISDISELLMIYAARSQLLENVIKPALLKGYWIVGDRYDFSSYAYQGGGRGIDESLLNMLSQVVIKDIYPDLVLYLDISPEVGLSRIKNRSELDRIEQESISFFNRVRIYYQKIVSSKKNVIWINANQSLEEVTISVYQYLNKLLYHA